jgi:magnesium-transporting ATPase (P-type)
VQETAINIGYACSLITDDMTQFQMQGACLETDKLEAEGRVSTTVLSLLCHEAAVAYSGSLLSMSRLDLGASSCACWRLCHVADIAACCCLCAVCAAAAQIEEATRISAERLESQLHKVKQTIEEDREKAQETPYALIIDGKALLYALSPRLRQLFLEVGGRPWAGTQHSST